MLRYRITKDLACLDKVAKYHLSATQRLRFYLQYRQRTRLNASDKNVFDISSAFSRAVNERFIASADQPLLARHNLADFESLWNIRLDAVDEPNTGRGGWSSVFRLDLDGQGFYLKRQSNYLTHTLHHPFGEPSFSREFRNISRYRKLGIPALQAVFYGERKVDGERRAILMTRALDGWTDLDELLQQWNQMEAPQRQAILHACGQLARTLHGAGQVHGCFYPKHIFLQAAGTGYQAQLIDTKKPAR